MQDEWKFWRYRDEFDAVLLGTAIGLAFCAVLALVLILV